MCNHIDIPEDVDRDRVMVMQEDEGSDLPPLQAKGPADMIHEFPTEVVRHKYAYKRSLLGSWVVIIFLLTVAGTLAVFLIR